MQQQPNRERELLSLLTSINQQLLHGAPLEQLLGRIADVGCRVTAADSCSVMLLDEGRQRLLCTGHAGLPRDEASRISFRLGEGVAGWVAKHGKGVRVADTRLDQRYKSIDGQRTQLSSLCCIPLFTREGVIGVMSIGSARPCHFGEDDQRLLSYLADAVAKDVDNARLYRLAVTDPLTGAHNRQHLSEQLPREVELHRRYGHPLSLVLIDLDHFKRVNDRFGHPVGDEVLRQIVARIRDMVRDVDHLVRFGGEEFVVVLPHTTADGAQQMIERLRRAVHRVPFVVTAGEDRQLAIELTISAGIAQLRPDPQESAERLLERADAALYRAKTAGRNRILVG